MNKKFLILSISILCSILVYIQNINAQISSSTPLNEFADYYVRSKTEIKYYDNAGQLQIIPVCLRTLKSNLKIREIKDDEQTAATMYGTLIYEALVWELVIASDLSNESIIYLRDLFLVEGELHNGQLYNTSLKSSDTEEKLFIYYFLYATSSNESVLIYYFDKNTQKLHPITFKYFEGEIWETFEIIAKSMEDNKIEPVEKFEIENNKINQPEYSIYTSEFWVGNPNTITTRIWEFKKENYSFLEIFRQVINQENWEIINTLP
jgi:hypothetical protein